MRIVTVNVGELHQTTKVCLYPVFLFPNGRCRLEFLLIYPSGRLECESKPITIQELDALIGNGYLRLSVREGERVYVPDIVSFLAGHVMPVVKEKEVLKEISDIIQELNGAPTTSDLCRAAYSDFLRHPTEANRIRLQEAYQRVPEHLACWLLSFDEKDIPIRKAIYGPDWKANQKDH
jgi:hypothetical protein